MNENWDWILKLQLLIDRYSQLNISGDISSLTLVEAWQLYCFLKRLEEENV
jgi:hypothetical protein